MTKSKPYRVLIWLRIIIGMALIVASVPVTGLGGAALAIIGMVAVWTGAAKVWKAGHR